MSEAVRYLSPHPSSFHSPSILDTRERPFSCRYCPNSYARKDLVLRHEKSLHVDVYTPPAQVPETISKNSSTNPQCTHNPGPPGEAVKANLSLEDLMNGRPRKPNLPASPICSDSQHNGSYDPFSEYPIGIDTGFNLPLTPVELSEVPPDFSYNHPESRPPPHGKVVLGGHPVQSQAEDNEQGQSPTAQGSNAFTLQLQGVNNQIPPHILDSMLYDLDFFGDMPPATDYEFISSTSADGIFSIDKPSSTNDGASSHDIGTDIHSPESTGETSQFLATMKQVVNQSQPAKSRVPYWTAEVPSSERTIGQRSNSFTLDDRIRQSMLIDLSRRLGPDQCKILKLPTASLLRRFLSSYQTCFHQHYPIIHLATIDLSQAPSPLILAICAIGALYRLDRKHAASLQQLADRAIRSVGFHLIAQFVSLLTSCR